MGAEAEGGFANADFVEKAHEEKVQTELEQRVETVHLYGVANELFQSRVVDTFTVERHGVELEFYRPMDATNVEPAQLEEALSERVFERIKEGSEAMDEFERTQERAIRAASSGEADLNDLLDDSLDGVELMRRVLAYHSVDESLTDPAAWGAIFRNQERLAEVFEDFTNEGSSESSRNRLENLQGLMSDSR